MSSPRGHRQRRRIASAARRRRRQQFARRQAVEATARRTEAEARAEGKAAGRQSALEAEALRIAEAALEDAPRPRNHAEALDGLLDAFTAGKAARRALDAADWEPLP